MTAHATQAQVPADSAEGKTVHRLRTGLAARHAVERPASPVPHEVAAAAATWKALRDSGQLAHVFGPSDARWAKWHSKAAQHPARPVEPTTSSTTNAITENTKTSAGGVVTAARLFVADADPLGQCPGDASGRTYDAAYSVTRSFAVSPSFYQSGAVQLTITNRSNFTWTPSEISLSYSLLGADGTTYLRGQGEGWATELSSNVEPGATVSVTAAVESLAAGTYSLVWEMYGPYGAFTNCGSVPVIYGPFTIPGLTPIRAMNDPWNNAQVGSLQPQLNVQVQYDPTWPVFVTFEICDIATTACLDSEWAQLPVRSGWQAFTPQLYEFTPPSGWLEWSRDYSWTFRVAQNGTTSDWMPTSNFSTSLPSLGAAATFGSERDYADGMGVNLFRGGYSRTETDLTLPGVAEPLQITRTYNSLNQVAGVFGMGWSSVLDSRWDQDSFGNVTITYPTGRRAIYGPNADGRYVAALGQDPSVRVSGANRQVWANGTAYRFDTGTGRITSMITRGGDVWKFASDATGHVTRIDDQTSKRSVYVTWAGNYVATISPDSGTSSPRIWHYDYDNRGTSSNYLRSVCDPLKNCAGYAYTSWTKGPNGESVAQLTYTATPADGYGGWAFLTYDDQVVVRMDLEGGRTGSWTYTRGGPIAHLPDGSPVADETTSVKVVDPLGGTRWFSFRADGALLARYTGSLTNPAAYWMPDAAGRPVIATDENGNPTVYTYDSTHDNLLEVDTYPQPGRASSQRFQYFWPDTWLALDVRSGWPTSVTDGNGHTTTYAYGPSSGTALLYSVTSPTGGVTSYTYTCLNDTRASQPPDVINDPNAPPGSSQPCELLSSVTDPDGRVTRYEYDRFGDVTQVRAPGGAWTDRFFDAYGNATSVRVITPQDQTGRTTTYTYDVLGNVTSITEPPVRNPITNVSHQKRTTNTYGPDRDLTKQVVADILNNGTAAQDPARTSVYTYDEWHDRTSYSLNGSLRQKVKYDGVGHAISTTDGNGVEQVTTYDPLGRVTGTSFPAFSDPTSGGSAHPVQVRTVAYDASGRLASYRDAMGHTVEYAYNGVNLKISETLRGYSDDGGATSHDVVLHAYSYDDAGNLVSDVQGSGSDARTTTFTYDDANQRLSTTVDPAGLNRTTTKTYDPAGLLAETSLSDGTRTERSRIEYGADGLPAKTAIAKDATTDLVTQITRDGEGRVLSSADPRGSLPLGVAGGADPTYTTKHTYDALGRLATTVLPSVPVDDGSGADATTTSPTTTRGYDTFGDVTDTADASGAQTHTEYDALGRPVRRTYATGQASLSYSQLVMADKPTHYWRLGEGAGTPQHDSMGHADLQWSGKPTAAIVVGGVPTDKPNVATDLTNANGLSTTTSVNSNAYTVEAWFTGPTLTYTCDPTGVDGCVGNTPAIAYNGDLTVATIPGGPDHTDPVIYAYLSGLNIFTDPIPALKSGWHHIAVTTDGAHGAVYIDGVIRGTASGQGRAYRDDGTVVGADAFNPVRYGGKIQDVGLYSRALTPAEINAHVQASTVMPTRAYAPRESWTYDGNGNVLTHLDVRDQTTRFAYDSRNRLVQTTTAGLRDGTPAVTRSSYDNNGNLLTTVDPVGAQHTFTYNGMDHVRQATAVDRYNSAGSGATTLTYAHNDFGETTSITGPGLSYTFTYSKAGELSTRTEPGRGTTRYGHDVAGRLSSVATPVYGSTQTIYDLAGRPTAVVNRNLLKTEVSRTSFAADAAGHITSVTDPLNHVWSAGYDALGRRTSLTDPAPATASGTVLAAPVTTMGYDIRGLPTRLTDAKGNTTLTTYNTWGLPATVTEPKTTGQDAVPDLTWTADYDTGGLQVSLNKPGNVLVASSYDAHGRLVAQTGTGGDAAASRDLDYDLDGRLVTAGTLSFAYDDRGHLLTTKNAGTLVSSATYDDAGRTVSTTDPAGTVNYTYANNADVASVTDSLTGLRRAYRYDDEGLLRNETFDGGYQRTFGYDVLRRLISDITTSSGTVTASLTYNYDLNSNLTSVTTGGQLTSPHTQTYRYDSENRLVREFNGSTGDGADYDWDAAGNRTRVGRWSGPVCQAPVGQDDPPPSDSLIRARMRA